LVDVLVNSLGFMPEEQVFVIEISWREFTLKNLRILKKGLTGLHVFDIWTVKKIYVFSKRD